MNDMMNSASGNGAPDEAAQAQVRLFNDTLGYIRKQISAAKKLPDFVLSNALMSGLIVDPDLAQAWADAPSDPAAWQAAVDDRIPQFHALLHASFPDAVSAPREEGEPTSRDAMRMSDRNFADYKAKIAARNSGQKVSWPIS